MKIITTLLLFVSCSFFSTVFGQEKENYLNQNNIDSTSLINKDAYKATIENLRGTYQFRVSKHGYSMLMSPDLLRLIIAERKQNEDVTISIDEHTNIFIPSETVISDPSFTPLDQIVYVTVNSINLSE